MFIKQNPSTAKTIFQYTAAVSYGVLSLVFALFAPVFTRFMLATPEAFVLALGGIAMIKALQGAFVTAFSTRFTFGALVTFVVTVSGLDLFNIHAAFWGILFGYTLVDSIVTHSFSSATIFLFFSKLTSLLLPCYFLYHTYHFASGY